jgi:hypothetical protein
MFINTSLTRGIQELGTTRGLEATPLVENGIIYTTGTWSVVYGRLRKVVLQANKNGFFYVLDWQTGEFLSAAPFVSPICLAMVNRHRFGQFSGYS